MRLDGSDQGGFHVGYFGEMRRGVPLMVGAIFLYFALLTHKRFAIWRNVLNF